MRSVKLSIIIPVYNVCKYINDCLTSIASQIKDLSKWVEFVCIDDGSTDGSSLILDKFKEIYPNISIKVIHKCNGGVSSARNRGILEADGEYVWFVDADDLVLNGSLSLFKNYLDFQYDVVSGLMDYCLDEHRFSNNDIIRRSLFIHRRYHFTSCIRKSLIVDNNLFFKEDLPFGEDLLFYELVNCFAKSHKKLNYCVYLYRNRIGSAMSRIDAKYLQCLYRRIDYYHEYDALLLDIYKKKYLLDRKNEVVRNIIFYSFRSGKNSLNKSLIFLKRMGLYPYRYIWSDIFIFHNYKDASIKYFCFLFPWKPYMHFVIFLSMFMRNGKQ